MFCKRCFVSGSSRRQILPSGRKSGKPVGKVFFSLVDYFCPTSLVCSPLAGQEHIASLTGCGARTSAPARLQRWKAPVHNLGTKFDSCSLPIPVLAFGFFSKPDEEKCLLLVIGIDRTGVLLELPEVKQAEQRNRQSPGLFSSQSLIADPPGTRRWICSFVFLSEVGADWFVKWLHAQMRYWDVQFDSMQHHSNAQAKLHTVQRRL